MYLILTFLALWTGIARAQFDIPTAMMMGMEPQQAMMFMGSGSGMGGGTGGGMDGMGGGMSGGGGGGSEFGQGGGQGTRGGGTMGGAVDGMGGGGSGGNMEMPSGFGGGNRGPNDRVNRFNRPSFNTQQNMGRFNMGGGGGGGGGSSNNNMGGSSTMMSMMLCQETPSRFRELPCNLNNPQSCPMSQYLTCQSGVYFYPVCCAKDWRSLRIVDVMF